jgi:putative intracellular protease/amidase
MGDRRIGMLLFPQMTQLDLTGPYEVLARLPNSKVDLIAGSLDPVTTDRGMQIVPTLTYESCPPLDVIMVPGGPGQQQLMEDEAALGFLRRQAATAKYVTSVCTGSLVLGARASEIARRHPGERACGRRRQYRHRRGRNVGHRFCSDARRDPRRRADGARNPVADRIRPGTTL